MLLLWTCTVLLTGLAIPLGSLILRGLRLNVEDVSDRFLASFWLGLSLLLSMLTGALIFVPLQKLTPAVFLVALPLAVALAFRHRAAWNLGLKNHRSFGAVALAVGCLFVLATVNPLRVAEFDTGLYHYQLTRWYYEYGAVPGLALIHHRFGFTSSVFALTALFDWGPLEARGASVPNLSALVVCVVYALHKIRAWLRNEAPVGQLFWPLGLLLGVSMFSIEVVSSLPDVMECLFVYAFVWYAFICEATVNREGPSHPLAPLGLVILGAGAFSVKSTGASLLLVGVLGAAYWFRQSWQRVIVVFATALLLTLPVFVVNTITSGYPFYPFAGIVAPVPWALTKADVTSVCETVRRFPLGEHGLSRGLTLTEKLVHLFQVDNWWLYSFGLLNLAGVLVLLKRRRLSASLVIALLLLLLGLLMLRQAPAARFVVGLLVVVPVLAISSTGEWWLVSALVACLALRLIMPWQLLNRLDIVRVGVYVALVPILLLSRHSPWQRRWIAVSVWALFALQFLRPLQLGVENGAGGIHHLTRFLLPEKLPHLEEDQFQWRQRGEVMVRESPDDQLGQCWATALPCAPASESAVVVRPIRYRSPTRDLRSGFEPIEERQAPERNGSR